MQKQKCSVGLGTPPAVSPRPLLHRICVTSETLILSEPSWVWQGITEGIRESWPFCAGETTVCWTSPHKPSNHTHVQVHSSHPYLSRSLFNIRSNKFFCLKSFSKWFKNNGHIFYIDPIPCISRPAVIPAMLLLVSASLNETEGSRVKSCPCCNGLCHASPPFFQWGDALTTVLL